MEIVKQNISQAKRYIRNQNYDDAMVVLNKVLSFQPNNFYAKKTKKKIKDKVSSNYSIEEPQELIDDLIFLYSNNDHLKFNSLIRKNIEIYRNSSTINHFMAISLKNLGDYDNAICYFKKSIEINPRYIEAINNLGNLYFNLERFKEALETYSKAIEINPEFSESYSNRSNTFLKLQDIEAANVDIDLAIKFNPNYYKAWFNKGNILRFKNDKKGAIECLKKSISIEKNFSEAHANLSSIYEELGDFNLALSYINTAITNDTKNYLSYFIRGVILNRIGNLKEAIENYDIALTYEPKKYKIIWNKANCQLLVGDFELGWLNYECRKKRYFWVERGFKFPELTSKEQINGSTILIYSEQGLGDTIQFSRYIKSFVELGAEVIFEVQRPLVGLFKSFDGIKIIGKGDHVPNVDYQLPIMSCGKIFNTNLSNIPVPIEINEDHDLTTEWKEKLDNGKKDIRIGVVWEGSKNHEDDKTLTKLKRSFPLETLVEKLAIPGIRLISLQREHKILDEKINTCLETLGSDFDNKEYAFKDSIAVMRNLDLVISCDTSIAHLAGTLNVPNWIALKYVPDWRWQLVRNDSPWYASTKLFRQPEWGDWDTVFDQMRTIIKKEFLI